MERKIGEEFEYDDITLKVEGCLYCDGCYFDDKRCDDSTREITGECNNIMRKDKNLVIFKEVENEKD